MKHPSAYPFPKNFRWGAATASAQIEGAAHEDGKSESVWDRFSTQPGKVVNGDTPATACDHYHRYRDDVRLMSGLGLQTYRLSVAWPRVVPGGTGAVNTAGLDFYDRLVDTLLAAGIRPYVTLYHWDLPQVLEDAGGWRVRATSLAFREYANAVVRRLGDRVRHWMTLNELPCCIGLGYGTGRHAPGAQEPRAVLNQCYHHAVLAHGYGVEAVREHGRKHSKVGLVHNPASPVPIMETAPDLEAARTLYAQYNAQVLGPIFLGRYPESFVEANGSDLPKVEPGDLETISQKTDFLGLNIYTGSFARAAAQPGGQPEEVAFPPHYPVGNIPWLLNLPQAIYYAIRHSAEVYGVENFYISENGYCADDEQAARDPDGTVLDLDRREYCRNYLMAVHRAVQEGYRVKGYFMWSLLDNYEWAEGYAKRFGICHVDFQTQERTPKLSAKWYAEVIRANGVV